MDRQLSFSLFFFLVVPFVLINITVFRKERMKADEANVHSLLSLIQFSGEKNQ